LPVAAGTALTALASSATAVFAVLVLGSVAPALAGPPYATDDPVPTDQGQWEDFVYVGGSRADGATEGEAGIDLNYGIAKDMQLTVDLPIAYERGSSLHGNLGRLETGLKIRFAHEDAASWRPDVAIFPAVIWPTATGVLDNDGVTYRLPLWIGKTLGPWSVFGGAAYEINEGAHRRDTQYVGITATHEFGERGSIGAEVFRETSDVPGEPASTGGNVGFEWAFVEHWSVVGSAGPTDLGSAREAWNFYLALRALY
jgi:hypothetical protein